MFKPYNSEFLVPSSPYVRNSTTKENIEKQQPQIFSQSEPKSQPYKINFSWTARFPESIFSHGPTNCKLAALTFDDSPDSLFAPVLLDILAHYDVKVTFFFLGRCVHQNPDVVERIAREGHEIGNHTYNHPDLTKISPAQIQEEILKTEDEIYRLVGLKTATFRPPYGFLNEESVRIILSLGYKIVLWNVDSYDWMGLTGPTITSRVIVDVTPGSIVLMHNACDGSTEAGTGTVQSLPFIIEILKAKGYIFTTAANLLNIPAYK